MRAAVLLLLLAAAGISPAESFDPLVAHTTSGTARGVPALFPFAESAAQWLGIPFAAPPVGARRFLPPDVASVPRWNDSRTFDEFAPDCWATNGGMSYSPKGMSEDCLYLNVYAPRDRKEGENLPVLVYFYGGGWNMGSASFPVYNGAAIIGDGDQRVVIVTVSYRLAHFGFLAGEQLRHLTKTGGVGNMGLLDQRAAMDWARANAKAFSGDPNRITIWGESAGAASTSNHLVMPGSAGKFNAAIMDSGPFGTWIADPMAEQQVQFDKIAREVGCDPNKTAEEVASCLQKVDASVLIKTHARPKHELGMRFTEFAPSIDGVEIPEAPWIMAEKGKMHKVPVLCGSNINEGTLLVGGGGAALPITKELTAEEYVTFVHKFFGDLAAEVLSLYPSKDYDSPWFAVTQIITDQAMACPVRRTAKYASLVGSPAFIYEFEHEIDVAKIDPYLGVFHGDDLVFAWVLRWFRLTYKDPVPPVPIPLTPDERQLQIATSSYWVSFAANHNPNSGSLPHWPVANGTAQPRMALQVASGLRSIPDWRPKFCDFWDKHPNWR